MAVADDGVASRSLCGGALKLCCVVCCGAQDTNEQYTTLQHELRELEEAKREYAAFLGSTGDSQRRHMDELTSTLERCGLLGEGPSV